MAYDFTGKSFCVQDVYSRIIEIIKRCDTTGIKIEAVISDMGAQNRSLWKMLNIVAGKHSKINNYIPHPCYTDRKLFFMPDPVHVFKNLAAAFTKGNHFK